VFKLILTQVDCQVLYIGISRLDEFASASWPKFRRLLLPRILLQIISKRLIPHRVMACSDILVMFFYIDFRHTQLAMIFPTPNCHANSKSEKIFIYLRNWVRIQNERLYRSCGNCCVDLNFFATFRMFLALTVSFFFILSRRFPCRSGL
jgi:hypothetical protein